MTNGTNIAPASCDVCVIPAVILEKYICSTCTKGALGFVERVVEETIQALEARGLCPKKAKAARGLLRDMFLIPLREVGNSDQRVDRIIRLAKAWNVAEFHCCLEERTPSLMEDACRFHLGMLRLPRERGVGVSNIMVAPWEFLSIVSERLGLRMSDRERALASTRINGLCAALEVKKVRWQSQASETRKGSLERSIGALITRAFQSRPLFELVGEPSPIFEAAAEQFLEYVDTEIAHVVSKEDSSISLTVPVQLKTPLRMVRIGCSALETGIQAVEYSHVQAMAYDEKQTCFLNHGQDSSDEVRAAARGLRILQQALTKSVFGNGPWSLGGSALVTNYYKNGSLSMRYCYSQLISGQQQFLLNPVPVSGDVFEGPIDELRVVSGLCLWSAGSVRGRYANGDSSSIVDPTNSITAPIVGIQIDQELSLYELESLSRLSRLIRLCTEARREACRVYLNVPATEYVLYLLEPFTRGLISRELLIEWTQAVTARSQLLKKLFAQSIGGGVEVVEVDMLRGIRSFVDDLVYGRVDVPGDALQIACAQLEQVEPLWRKALLARRSEGKSEGWLELNHLGYALAELQVADTTGNVGALTLGIENRHEGRIFERAARLCKQLGIPSRMLGLLSHEPLEFCAQGVISHLNPYFAPRKLSQSEIKEVLRGGEPSSTHDGGSLCDVSVTN